ncbi:hypothetical protein FQA39_LY18881 [Lamprigera yunnana]|nr:hypothetical protein FQA39_LY18881 [Lamprigera yunnana]
MHNSNMETSTLISHNPVSTKYGLLRNNSEDTTHQEKQNSFFGVRHVQILFLALLLCIGYGMRVNLSVGIVAMTDPTINPGFKTYDWHDESVILSSFFWGYILPQVIAGQVSTKYGARWFLVGTMAVCSLFTVLIPWMADLGSWGVMICRILQGGPLGSVIAMPVTGWISGSSFGWPFAFYIYGLAGFIWVIAFAIFGSNSPAEHTSISVEEKVYIEMSLGVKTEESEKAPTPWKAIFTSLPVWAILMTHCAQNWGFWTLITEMPTYMKNVMNFDIKRYLFFIVPELSENNAIKFQNGLLSACPKNQVQALPNFSTTRTVENGFPDCRWFYIFGNTFYVICGSGDIQPWDTCEAIEEDDIEKNQEKPVEKTKL